MLSTWQWHAPAGVLMTATRDKDGVLDAREAGKFIREKLRAKGWQVQQLAERTTVSDPDYLSNMLSGRVNVAKSRHLKSIARELGLTPSEIEHLNPNLVINLTAMDDAHPARETETLEVAPALQEAVELFSPRFPEIGEERWLRFLMDTDFREEPETPEDWLSVFLALRKHINPQ